MTEDANVNVSTQPQANLTFYVNHDSNFFLSVHLDQTLSHFDLNKLSHWRNYNVDQAKWVTGEPIWVILTLNVESIGFSMLSQPWLSIVEPIWLSMLNQFDSQCWAKPNSQCWANMTINIESMWLCMLSHSGLKYSPITHFARLNFSYCQWLNFWMSKWR